MTITINDIANLRIKSLKTVSSKLIYLMILNQADEQGWSAISFATFADATGMPIRSIVRVLSRLEAIGLIEKSTDKQHNNSTNQYRIIQL
jgi:DNA-binding MarR family transcriptional regulator